MPEREPAGPEGDATTFNILFLCTGNTCRSPMAEVLARRDLERRGWRHVAVASAGIAAAAGGEAAENAVRVSAEAGLDLTGHRTRPLDRELAEWADIILAMAPPHLVAVDALGVGERAALLSTFAGESGPEGIPDPFGGNEQTYRDTFEHLRAAVRGALDRLEPILAP